MNQSVYKISVIALCAGMATGLFSCENQENHFPDFDYTTGFFPYQYPVRTLILGNYYLSDNSNDNAHKFVVSAAMGGVYENREERKLNFVVDEDLCTDAFFADGSPVRPLPASYYTLSDPEKILIQPGHFNGGIEVQLTDAFFNDPLAIRNTYVLPLRITGVVNLDSLLEGQAASAVADPRISSQWTVAPRHFTLFAVKFINPFHGHFLQYGKSTVTRGSTAVEETVYSTPFVENNSVVMLTTAGRTGVSMASSYKSKEMIGQFRIVITFASDNYQSSEGVTCTVAEEAGEPYTVTGTGKYLPEGGYFGGKRRDAIYLDYTVTTDNESYHATDTLLLRDKDVDMELYTPSIKK
jgi:hypothetical protein